MKIYENERKDEDQVRKLSLILQFPHNKVWEGGFNKA